MIGSSHLSCNHFTILWVSSYTGIQFQLFVIIAYFRQLHFNYVSIIGFPLTVPYSLYNVWETSLTISLKSSTAQGASLRRVKLSGIRQSKISKSLLGSKGLKTFLPCNFLLIQLICNWTSCCTQGVLAAYMTVGGGGGRGPTKLHNANPPQKYEPEILDPKNTRHQNLLPKKYKTYYLVKHTLDF